MDVLGLLNTLSGVVKLPIISRILEAITGGKEKEIKKQVSGELDEAKRTGNLDAINKRISRTK